MKYLNTMLVIGLLIVLTLCLSQCLNNPSLTDPRGEAYAGSTTCLSCHKNIADAYIHTNHYKTSSKVDHLDLKKLVDTKLKFFFTDSSYITIEDNGQNLNQTYFTDNKKITSEHFDIAFGSAEKAQTYAYWKDDTLYQLPLTWFANQDSWVNSPGFPARHARFNRTIVSRCFECHASYVNRQIVQTGPVSTSEILDKNTIIYSIDCERCHGPAAAHVRWQQENPTIKTGKYIASIKTLTRQQKLDICGSCHSGNDLAPQKPLFAFVPGDTLSHFLFPDFGGLAASEPDVHGKQLQLLQASACFQRSDMTCNTCHDSHGSQQNSIAFINKCMDCHQSSQHASAMLKENEQKKRDFNLTTASCIDCHMPLQTSKTIYFNNGTESKNFPYLLRTHKIDIYK